MNHFCTVVSILITISSCSHQKTEQEEEFLKPEPLPETAFKAASPAVFIKGGMYVPLYGKTTNKVTVKEFQMDVFPVTNQEYIQFVKQNSRWRKSKVLQLFCDQSYLNNWINDTTPAAGNNALAPVTNVSWHAAKAYCECQGKRLPTVDEWEYVAMANEQMPDARKVQSFNQYILDWYEKPKAYTSVVGSTFKNYWGVYDMHGLVWEWTYDFNSVLFSGESRNDVETDRNLFCGSGSLNATDLMNYAAFMRYAFRSSMQSRFTANTLGFRCVKDTTVKTQTKSE